jgi:hypothetical protein
MAQRRKALLIASRATGIGAPDDMKQAHRAQAWLAASDDAVPLAVGNPHRCKFIASPAGGWDRAGQSTPIRLRSRFGVGPVWQLAATEM